MSGERSPKREEFLREVRQHMERASRMTPEELTFPYLGVLYPSVLCSAPTFLAMATLAAREDDVLVVTYPKCGTNWTIEILHEMLFGLQNKEPTVTQAMLEFGKPDKFEHLNQQPSPRVFSSHLTPERIPKTFFEKKSKTLLILRNPKDAAVSYYHFCNKNPVLPTYPSWDKFFQDFLAGNVLYGSYFDYILGWEKHADDGNLLVLTFEDMKADLPAQLRRIGDFCGFSLTEEQIRRVEEKTAFASMKEKSGDTHGNMGDFLFRKGEVGDWRSLFRAEQSRALDLLYDERVGGARLGGRINYAKYCAH